MPHRELVIEGARQNNLRNISLRLPHDTVIAITGVSGSGKSSLAFDTIFAEGQWRFIESLSTYARIFLEKLDRPDVDAILNIRPAVALEQKNPVRGSRSTVGTLTELYDYFRLLYAKVATPFCPGCGREIRKWDPSQVVSHLMAEHTGERAAVLFRSVEPVDELLKKGYRRFWINGEITDIDDLKGSSLLSGPTDGKTKKSRRAGRELQAMAVVLDRLVIRDDPRLSDSVEMAWKQGNGKIEVVIFNNDDGPRVSVLGFSSDNACEACGIMVPPPSAILFSFNHPVGACPECKGFGNTLRYDEDLVIPDKNLSLAKGAVEPWTKPANRWWKKQLTAKAGKAGLDINKPYAGFTDDEKALLFKGGEGFYGIDDFFEDMESRKYKLHVRVFLSRYRRGVVCPVCDGKRLTKEALAYRIGGMDIADLARLPVADAERFFSDIDLSPFQKDMVKELLRQISMKLGFLREVGLDYLSLERYGKTLSGGEFQRINLSNQLASRLTGTLYVLDEPTVGLHARDTERVSGIMNQLAGLGNTVIVVEHDMGIIRSAEWVVELGPGGGHKGGEVVFSGAAEEFVNADTLTAKYIRGEQRVGISHAGRQTGPGNLTLFGARGNNLKGADLVIPLGGLSVVCGVSGSGKSSLVVDTLYRALAKRFRVDNEPPLPFGRIEGDAYLSGVRLIDQSPIGKSPRSNPATYLKLFDHIRKLFAGQREARAYGYGPGFFSFNVPGGRCETCRGEGYELLEMYFFENLYVTCEKCGGRRYGPEALRITYREKNICDVLNMTVEEGLALFHDHPQIVSRLQLLKETGLGYLKLGQPATTLSGGEAQRMKICAELSQVTGTAVSDRAAGTPKILNPRPYLYILDEPTVGLHFADVQALLDILNRLAAAGNTVVVIEHNLDVIRAADWIVDLGPEGGDGGGTVLYAGPPEGLVDVEKSHTGRYLAAGSRV